MSYEVIKRVNVTHKPGAWDSQAWIESDPIQPGHDRHYALTPIRRQLRNERLRRLPNRDYHRGHRASIHSPASSQSQLLTQPTQYGSRFSAAVSVQIGVSQEDSENLGSTVKSLAEAAEAVKKTGPVILMPYLNYVTPGWRNEQTERASLQERARGMEEVILEAANGSNMVVCAIIDTTPSARTWPERRNMMAGLAAEKVHDSLSLSQNPGADSRNRVTENTPYWQLDADITVGNTALLAVREALEDNKALIVNGTLHYAGGTMEKSSQEVAKKEPIGVKLLYFVEMMRRRMFDHLDPLSFRGYIPDILATKLGTIRDLGGYYEHDPQNESYYLAIKAAEAWMRQMHVDVRNPHFPNASIDIRTANELDGITYYAPYQEAAVNTSVRGLESMVEDKGPIVLIDFDQGRDYTPWTEREISRSRRRVREPLREELLEFINSVYSAFIDRGGSLPQEDGHADRSIETLQSGKVPLEDMNLQELAAVLFPQLREHGKSTEPIAIWRLVQLPKERWQTEDWPQDKWPKSA